MKSPSSGHVGNRSGIAPALRRVVARLGMTQAEVAAATRLDERTVRSLLRGEARPHARTLHKIAAGLGVDVAEFMPDYADQAAFDRASNPAVADAVEACPQLFAQWTAADFEELFSRVAVGGELTEEGALAAARAMNRRRQLMKQVALLLETDQAELLADFIAMLYRRATSIAKPR